MSHWKLSDFEYTSVHPKSSYFGCRADPMKMKKKTLIFGSVFQKNQFFFNCFKSDSDEMSQKSRLFLKNL